PFSHCLKLTAVFRNLSGVSAKGIIVWALTGLNLLLFFFAVPALFARHWSLSIFLPLSLVLPWLIIPASGWAREESLPTVENGLDGSRKKLGPKLTSSIKLHIYEKHPEKSGSHFKRRFSTAEAICQEWSSESGAVLPIL